MGRRTRGVGIVALAGRIDGENDGQSSEAGNSPTVS